mgnify:FL=1
MNCSPVKPVVILREHRHCLSDSASISSNLQALEPEKTIRMRNFGKTIQCSFKMFNICEGKEKIETALF